MEFLTRILDARRVQGRRWFLSAVESSYSGLVGKKPKEEKEPKEKKVRKAKK
jgi:hypothetical protein